jgi:hypothetical protein
LRLVEPASIRLNRLVASLGFLWRVEVPGGPLIHGTTTDYPVPSPSCDSLRDRAFIGCKILVDGVDELEVDSLGESLAAVRVHEDPDAMSARLSFFHRMSLVWVE